MSSVDAGWRQPCGPGLAWRRSRVAWFTTAIGLYGLMSTIAEQAHQDSSPSNQARSPIKRRRQDDVHAEQQKRKRLTVAVQVQRTVDPALKRIVEHQVHAGETR